MIVSLVKEAAEKQGIQNANQLKEALGVSPTLAARLWRGDFTQIGTVTLDRLCRELKCQPGQLLSYKPGQHKRLGKLA